MGYYWFFWIGAAAYIVPIMLFLVGLGCFFEAFGYLRRRWLWFAVLLLCCMGLLDLYGDYFKGLQSSLSITAGGVLGINLNKHLFGYFGTVGATILFLMLYFISLLFLTNFQLGSWVRALWGKGTTTSRANSIW